MAGNSIPTAASSWNKGTLEALNASYDRHDVYDFIFEEQSIPSGVKEGMPPAPFSHSTTNVFPKESKTWRRNSKG
jgi:hypothetical protein